MLRTRLRICAFVVGSPKLWAALLAPHPTKLNENIQMVMNYTVAAMFKMMNKWKLPLARNRSSCRIQTAFKQSIDASINDHNVNILIAINLYRWCVYFAMFIEFPTILWLHGTIKRWHFTCSNDFAVRIFEMCCCCYYLDITNSDLRRCWCYFGGLFTLTSSKCQKQSTESSSHHKIFPFLSFLFEFIFNTIV